MTKTITLTGKHFKNADYCNNRRCAIANAVQELFPGSIVREGVQYVHVNSTMYLHEEYSKDMFDSDMNIAEQFNYSKDIALRKIEITEYDPRDMDTNKRLAGISNADMV